MESFIVAGSPEETFNLGKKLGRNLKRGKIICLYGELGAGKTVFAKGLGEGLGVQEEITSPTFTLIQEYNTKVNGLTLVHMDLYRLRSLEEAEIIGVMDYFRNDCVCLLEWPEIISDFLPDDRVEIRIEGSGDSPRKISISSQ